MFVPATNVNGATAVVPAVSVVVPVTTVKAEKAPVDLVDAPIGRPLMPVAVMAPTDAPATEMPMPGFAQYSPVVLAALNTKLGVAAAPDGICVVPVAAARPRTLLAPPEL